ncbi:hypothetical protein Q428_00980 [Fervidicella metallireducens AeB]|uniref:DDH domain-containing protein n=1 Tax=Fervidicella metallireducens AeB TaxID=1403537 RepID=A0A017RYG4_9CLOT|nr:DHH family phosphoesterase [Fervidicella metallireducens]EYE89712.1 hypothetical protein Q428_00980 [Fervidicella metallireducens AeB]
MEKWLLNKKLDSGYLLGKNNLICKTAVPKELKKEFSKSGFNDVFRLYNPFLLKDMDKAVDRIDAAIKGRQRVIVFGNNGIDGILSTSIIYKALMKLGADVSYYIPDGNSGEKGLSIAAVEYVKNLAYDVIIVVGCGNSSDYEAEYAKALGMDVIIVDYNQSVSGKSDAIVINPNRNDCEYPFKDLTGCGVAFKFIQALWHYYGLNGCEDFFRYRCNCFNI